MTKIITLIALFVTTLLSAQTPYEKGMQKALQTWRDGNPTEASAQFERIASVEKNNWLPNYYVALVNTTSAFGTKDSDQISALLTKAQTALDIELDKNPKNPELLVLQAMIHTAYIASDPMTYGMILSGKVMELYNQAEAIAPENPRVVSGKAEFEIGGAKWTGANVKELCKDVERSIELFNNFKPETPFSPNWGLDRAKATLESCGK
jgi:hypothetical protein